MRKKIMSVLLALCMVIALLPISAFAATLTDAQVAELKDKGYTDEQIEEIKKQIANYESDEVVLVFEDTTISAAESRLVVVVAPKAVVTVEAAKLDTGIVVAPGAAEAKIVLKSEADVNAVVVLDKAEVVVEEGAQATYVTVAAAETSVTVEGTVSVVTVGEQGEKSTVTVAEGGTAETVEVAAPETKTEIAGTATNVSVSETAKGAETTVAETATTSSVTVAAPEAKTEIAAPVSTVTVTETAAGSSTKVADAETVTVSAPEAKTEVTGTVENVTVTETAEGSNLTVTAGGTVNNATVDAANTEVENRGDMGSLTVGESAANTTVSGKNPETVTDPSANVTQPKDPAPVTDPDSAIPEAGPSVIGKAAELIKTAPLDDHNTDNNLNGAITSTAGDRITNGLASDYKVTVTKAAGKDNTYGVTVVAKDLLAHMNSEGAPWRGYHVGVSIPVMDGYKNAFFYATKDGEGNIVKTEVSEASMNTWTDEESGIEYQTIYWTLPGEKNPVDTTETDIYGNKPGETDGTFVTDSNNAPTQEKIDEPYKTLIVELTKREDPEAQAEGEAEPEPSASTAPDASYTLEIEIKVDKAPYSVDTTEEVNSTINSSESEPDPASVEADAE